MSILTEEEVFAAAIQRPLSERGAYLDRACGGDRLLRAQVESLLAAHDHPDSLLEDVTCGRTIDSSRMIEGPGTQIGPYKLLEQIGEGGMGVVYVASQSTPVHRQVALKVIKPGMDSQEVVRRFEAERQALAIMDHPNIAKVFDGGATETGRPYFVMELVRGTQITEFCDQHQLTTRQRLELFVTLCHGVQHAHQKGVIHRDLKPSNLLVEVHDSHPVPKIIDFGIVKAMGQQLTGQSLLTHMSQLVGTPLYMSPEQAGQDSADIDTRSDIYSLGVVLYEMLTGTTPFEKDSLRTAGVDEMRRIIREVDPPRPSARVSTLQAADLSTIAERHHIEPRKLSQELRGELDWIVMKALDKDRNRRYETANGLAADVERYLHDEPVQACPPSAAYRFTKFARRNRAALVTSGLLALALIVGTGVSIWQAVRATNAEGTAIAERDKNGQLALHATRAEEQTAKALLTAQERLQFGRQAVDEMYTQVAEKWLAQQAELTQVQKQFLEKASAFYQQLATEQSDDPTIRFETAKAQQRAGAIQFKLGQHKESEASLRQSRDLLHQLAREKPDEPPYRDSLAQTQRILGNLLSFTGRRPEAEQELRSAVKICQALAAEFPGEAEYQVNLADRYYNLGRLLRDTGRACEAEAAYRQSITLLESLPANSRDDPGRRAFLAVLQDVLAGLIRADKPAEAEALYCAAIQANTALLTADPKNTDYRGGLAANHNNLGILFHLVGRPLEAEASYRAAVAMYQELVAEWPDIPFHRLQIAKNLDNLASLLEAAGKHDEAIALAFQSLEVLDRLVSDYPDVPEYPTLACRTRILLATSQFMVGKLEEARASIQDVVQRSLDHPDLYVMADLLTTAPEPFRDPDLALRLARRAVELKPGDGVRQQSLGWALYRSGDLPGAIEALQKTSDGGERDFVRAMIHWQLGEKTEARASFDGASEQLKSYEPRYEENLKRGILTFPLPVQLKRLQAEAAALLGVTLPAVEPAPEPAAKVEEAKELPKTTPAPEAAKEEEKSQ